MLGASASITIMLKIHLDVFEARSVAVQVTFVLPIGKLDPEGGVH